MSEDGKNILNNVKQIKIVLKDIARLLETVDDLMLKEDWNPAWSNTSIAYSSSSIKHPEGWIPSEIFRFYKKKNDNHRLSFVSVLLDDDREQHYTIIEPLVTAGYFDFGNKEVDNKWSYSWSRSYGYHDNTEHDGRIVPFIEEIENEDNTNSYPFDSGKGFGWPLTSIKNTKDIQSKIIEPLLKLLKENK